MDDSPEYTKYTLKQLYDAYKHINKEKYPDRYVLVMQEMQRREKESQVDIEDEDASTPELNWIRWSVAVAVGFTLGAITGGLIFALLWRLFSPIPRQDDFYVFSAGLMMFLAPLVAFCTGICGALIGVYLFGKSRKDYSRYL